MKDKVLLTRRQQPRSRFLMRANFCSHLKTLDCFFTKWDGPDEGRLKAVWSSVVDGGIGINMMLDKSVLEKKRARGILTSKMAKVC